MTGPRAAAGLRRVRGSAGGRLGSIGLACLLLACNRLRSPETVCATLTRGIAEGDSDAIFEALLPNTQASLASVSRNHRKMRSLIESDYPAAERPAALARLYDAVSGRDLFAGLYGERLAQDFAARLGSGPLRIEAAPDTDSLPAAYCRKEHGRPFRLAREGRGGWGLAELDREWEAEKLRAYHDLETVKKNAELYRRAQRAR